MEGWHIGFFRPIPWAIKEEGKTKNFSLHGPVFFFFAFHQKADVPQI